MCGLMRPTVCESVRGQDKLQDSRSIGGVDVGECRQERKAGEMDGRCLVRSALKLGVLRAEKCWVIDADDSGR